MKDFFQFRESLNEAKVKTVPDHRISDEIDAICADAEASALNNVEDHPDAGRTYFKFCKAVGQSLNSRKGRQKVVFNKHEETFEWWTLDETSSVARNKHIKKSMLDSIKREGRMYFVLIHDHPDAEDWDLSLGTKDLKVSFAFFSKKKMNDKSMTQVVKDVYGLK